MLYKIIKAKVSLKLTFLLFSFISLVFQTIGQEIEIDRKSYENTKDKLPSFPGGDTALVNYINKNLLIPIKVINKGTQGTVLLEFIVTENGDIMEIEVVKDIGDNCGEIAKKLVENMPKWEPAVHNKKPIVAPYVLAIDFNMNSQETSMKNNEAPKKNKNRMKR